MQPTFDFLADLPKRPRRPERLFFGILPDRDSAARIAQFRDRLIQDNGLTGSPIEEGRLHLSLNHVGDYPRLRTRFVHFAQKSAGDVSMPAFDATFSRVTTFESFRRDGKWPVVLLGEGAGLHSLQDRLGHGLKRNGFPDNGGFVPHITLLYAKRRIPAQSVGPYHVKVDNFVLIHSELWLRRYNILDRWVLSAW